MENHEFVELLHKAKKVIPDFRNELADALDVSLPTVDGWLDGSRLPGKIAQKFVAGRVYLMIGEYT